MPETYETLGGIHELGSDSTPADIRTERADGWSPHLKVVASATHARNLSPEFADDAIRVMRWWEHNGYRSDHIGAWIGNDNPVSSAKRWVNHMRAELDILASTGRVWYVETMNEVGVSRTLCEFDAAVGMELKRIYPNDQIRVASLSMSSGSFNDQHNWDLMINHFIKPLNAAGVKFALSFHCYSSWLPIVGNFPGKQHADLAPRFPNISWQEMGMEKVPPFDMNYDGPRYDWTGFAVESLIRRIGNTPILITEQDIDNMGPIGHGSAGGHYEWDRRGYYDFLKTQTGWDVDTLVGHGLWYAERRYRAINKGGGNILAVFPFTYSDQDRFSRWYRDYRHKGGILNVFKSLARSASGSEPPPHEKPDFPQDDRIYARTMTTTAVNVRPEPNTSKPAIASLDPTKTYVVTHIVKDGQDIWLRVDYGFHTYGWSAYLYRGAQITEISDPLDTLPMWGGGFDANDDSWMHEPEEPTNGNGEPTVIEGNLLGFKIEGQPTIEQLRPMMEARKPAYCTVVVEVGEAAYVASLAQAFPDTIFGVLFNINIDFGELVHENPATPTDFAPLYNAATTREAQEEFFNPNSAWKLWRNGTNANGKKLLADFQHLAGLSAAARRRVLILSFWELPFDDKLTAAYIDFEKERIIQEAFETGLGAVVLNHRGRDQNETYFQMLGRRGMHNAIKTVNDQVGHQNSSIGRTDHAGLLLELLHGPDNQAVEPDGHLSRHTKDIINQTPVYEAQDFNPVAGGDKSLLAFKILADHHRINHYLPFPSVANGIPIRITSFGYDGDAGSDNYRHYHSEGKSLEGYHDNAPVWESWGLDPVEALKKQLAYAVTQISRVPQVSGIALDNVFGGGPRDVSDVAFYDVVEPEPEPEARILIDPQPSRVGDTVTLTNDSIGNIVTAKWTVPSSMAVISEGPDKIVIVPAQDGDFTVTLTITDLSGVERSATVIVLVLPRQEPKPQAVILGKLAAYVGETVMFIAGESPGQITSYLWSIDGTNGSATYQTKTIAHEFTEPGVYVITLRVEGPEGNHTAQRSMTISELPEPPEEKPGVSLPNLPDWIPFMAGTITGAVIVLITMAVTGTI